MHVSHTAGREPWQHMPPARGTLTRHESDHPAHRKSTHYWRHTGIPAENQLGTKPYIASP